MIRSCGTTRVLCCAHGAEHVRVGPWLWGAVCSDPVECAAEGHTHHLTIDTLWELQAVSDCLGALTQARDDLILRALGEGHSERRVGRAAGISGPAVHLRKVNASTSKRGSDAG